MQTNFMKRAAFGAAAMLLAGAAQAAGVPGQGTWETTLKGRDINGNLVNQLSPSAVFLYDTELKVTWLRDANQNGAMDWNTAVAWADNLVVGAYDDWRLPSALNTDGSWPCEFDNCTDSQMGHLYYKTLGNKAPPEPGWGLTNTGSFQSLQAATYWYEEANADLPWFFWFGGGFQGYGPSEDEVIYALAVRPGDVALVPEPKIYALLMLGLGAVIVAARRRPH